MTTPKRHVRNGTLVLQVAVLVVALIGCQPAWQATVQQPDGTPYPVDRDVLEDLQAFAEERDGKETIPLEQVLYASGHQVIERLVAIASDGTRREFDWASAAGDAWWLDNGRLALGEEAFPVSRIEVQPPELLGGVQACITDIAPTVAAALGLPAPAQALGHALQVPSVRHVLLVFLDGFGYVRYAEAQAEGLIPYLSTLAEPLLGLTTYPPVTTVSTASLLTGAPPAVHGAGQRHMRKTEAETLFDVAAAAGLRVVAVEGNALAFALRGAEVQLSRDRDEDGSTDDDVLANAMAVLEVGMPDLFYVHWHGIDDAGHEYGPGAPEEEAKIAELDTAVQELIAALPTDTLIVIFADHGMHRVDEDGRLGNHGHLIERDMFIPIWVIVK
jgi:hypothetical protein